MTDTIKVAVIGAGMMGKNHLKTYKGLNGVELVGVYDIFPKPARRLPKLLASKRFLHWKKLRKTLMPSVLLPPRSLTPKSANSS